MELFYSAIWGAYSECPIGLNWPKMVYSKAHYRKHKYRVRFRQKFEEMNNYSDQLIRNTIAHFLTAWSLNSPGRKFYNLNKTHNLKFVMDFLFGIEFFLLFSIHINFFFFTSIDVIIPFGSSWLVINLKLFFINLA